MKTLLTTFAAVAMVVMVGCGKTDVNRDFKPVASNAPKPQFGGATGAGSGQPSVKAPAAIR